MKEQEGILELLNVPLEHPFATAAIVGLASFYLIKRYLDGRPISDMAINPISPRQEQFVRYVIPSIAMLGTWAIVSVMS